mmetsp:Transcript_28377/g.67163  ORF Transcript_28377/g.67163 Transcript_28377/m.67163 type:complete len:263 (-) Transcript_28377:75-863(-)
MILEDVAKVNAESVVFNWECCGACTHNAFPDPDTTIRLAKLLLDRGHMCLFADFSLKALIAHWRDDLFGPNPFLHIGGFSGNFSLRFDPQHLEACPSPQLAAVAKLCGEGGATLAAMSDTIMVTVDPAKADTPHYTLDILTVATTLRGQPYTGPHPVTIGDHKGALGHALLSYPGGGKLMVSAGHWVELSNLDNVTEDKIIETCQKQMGATFSARFSSKLASYTPAERAQSCQMMAQQLVQQTAPCSYSGPSNYSGRGYGAA